MLQEVSQRATKAHEDMIKEVLNNAVIEMKDNMAAQVKDSYVEQVETYNENLQDILKRGFGMSREEVYDFLYKSEKNAHEFSIKELKSVFQQNANQNLLRKFNEHFKKDETG